VDGSRIREKTNINSILIELLCHLCQNTYRMKLLKNYFNHQIDEIKSDKALQFYGVFLGLSQVLTFFTWIGSRQRAYFTDIKTPICWPFFENCHEFRISDPQQMKFILIAFGLVSFLSAVLFLSNRFCKTAYWWLIGTNIFKTLLYILDFRLRMNQHYMLYFATIAFLFFPYKRNLLRFTLVSFYVWASTLKYNLEWIAGDALYQKVWFFKGRWIQVACFYVVILESFIVLGLLVRKKWVYWAAFVQLILFHVMSYPVVNYFYPMLMVCLLMIFPLTRFFKYDDESSGLLVSLVRGKEAITTYAFIGLFSFLQLIPYMMPGDSKVTGEGRLFALHMFDALVSCEGNIILHYENQDDEEIPIPIIRRNRTKCDPIVNTNLAKAYCRQHQDDSDFISLDLQYSVRRAREKIMRPLVDIKDFCRQDISYTMLKPNPWILK